MITILVTVGSRLLRCVRIHSDCELSFVPLPRKGLVRHAQIPRIPIAVSITAFALVCGLSPAAAAPLLSGSPAHLHRTAVVLAPLDGDDPCPGGEAKPCSASPEERGAVDGDRAAAKQDAAAAKQDIGAAKQEAQKCTAESKACMTQLIGGGTTQETDMAQARDGLGTMRPAPSNNAETALDGTCASFAADLPAGLSNAPEMGSLCGEMNR
ncbi:hypothetical protein [Streptomyces sp. NPDC091371]|uniref:hypothetical protein n=1 Tax=Streptomyces sp. NPDC091371 TaxID=3155303 RepID=UPI003415B973